MLSVWLRRPVSLIAKREWRTTSILPCLALAASLPGIRLPMATLAIGSEPAVLPVQFLRWNELLYMPHTKGGLKPHATANLRQALLLLKASKQRVA